MILSVVIPCYNHGQYLQEAIDSVLTYQDQPIEIIIANDGSTDLFTINKITELREEGYQIIQHKNSGLAFSRNAGIELAKGKYILPLDADNKIKADYIRKALPILESNTADIVYAKPTFFGEKTQDRIFESKEFSGPDLIFGNYIDACAIYRKEVWIKNNGYDKNMPHQGHEDWEFWINSFSNGFKFHFINEELYDYRIDINSMISGVNNDKFNLNHNYIFIKHQEQLLQFIRILKLNQVFFENDQKNYLRTSLKYFIKSLMRILHK